MMRKILTGAVALLISATGVVATATASSATANTPCTTVRVFNDGTQYRAVYPGTASGSTDCYLVKGNQGRGVSALQRALTYCENYSTNGIDGSFGNNTYGALRSFQSARAIAVDGRYGNQTRNTLWFWSGESDGWGFCN